MNEILLFAEIAIFFGGILLIKKFFGVSGIYSWITLATCLAEIQVCKGVEIFGIGATMGNVLFASTFLATDILRECYGKEYANKGPLFGLLGAVIYIIFSIITPLAKPADFDVAQNAMKILFTLSIRITTCSIVMLFLANLLDVYLYEKMFNKMKGKNMWLRNNVCTIICNCVENYFFTFMAFYGIYDIKDLFIIATSTTVIEIIIAFCDTPFLYLAKKIK